MDASPSEEGVPPRYHDLPAELRAEALARTWQDRSSRPLDQPWPLPAWPDLPTRVLTGGHDRMFPLEFQRRITQERLGLQIDQIDGGHMVAISHPRHQANQLETYRLTEQNEQPNARQ